MKNMLKRIVAVIMVLVLACAVISTAAAEDFGYKAKRSKPVHLTLHEDSTCGLAKGGKLQLSMAKADGTALQATSFHSNRTSVATVNASGIVKGKRAGKAKITMTADTGEKYALTVTVADPNAPDAISFTKTEYKTCTGVETDLTGRLSAKPYTEALNLKKLSWSTSNPRVVTVDQKGNLIAQGAGKATVTVRTPNGKAAAMGVVVEKNKLDNIQPPPMMTAIDYGEEIYLKSVEIVHPGIVACEYYLLFKHLPAVHSTYFSWVEDHISVKAKGETIQLVDGSMPYIKVRTRGQTIKVFKVTYKGDAVKDTNVKLSKYSNKISWNSSFWLNWSY